MATEARSGRVPSRVTYCGGVRPQNPLGHEVADNLTAAKLDLATAYADG